MDYAAPPPPVAPGWCCRWVYRRALALAGRRRLGLAMGFVEELDCAGQGAGRVGPAAVEACAARWWTCWRRCARPCRWRPSQPSGNWVRSAYACDRAVAQGAARTTSPGGMNIHKWRCSRRQTRPIGPAGAAFVSASPATLPERIIVADIPPLAHAPNRAGGYSTLAPASPAAWRARPGLRCAVGVSG